MAKLERLEKLLQISRKRYDLQIKADWRYRQFFDFLQISPSYRLVHLIATGKLKRNEVELLCDIETVEDTYNAFGDVWEIDFWKWWIDRAQYQFGISVTPSVHKITSVDVGNEISESAVTDAQIELEQYLRADRLAEGKPASIIVGVPLHGERKQIIKQFAEMLDSVYEARTHQRGIAPYQVTRNKIREQTLKNAMRVLRARAALPNKPLFVIGNKSKIAPAYETDENNRLRNDERRRLMEILTSRQLHRAYLFAEHAARGSFPCNDPLPEDDARPAFEYVMLKRQFTLYITRMKKLTAKLKGEIGRRKAKK
jgi:hypothetical protein